MKVYYGVRKGSFLSYYFSLCHETQKGSGKLVGFVVIQLWLSIDGAVE